jgi:hypothetical protein
MILFLEVGYPLGRALFLLCRFARHRSRWMAIASRSGALASKLSACNPSGERKIIAKWYSEISGS